jgi:[protein-PII] uridylyltransferase
LYDLTSAISDLNLDITSAHITTFGEKAVDVFYVTDLTGKKINNSARERAIRQRLTDVLQSVSAKASHAQPPTQSGPQKASSKSA